MEARMNKRRYQIGISIVGILMIILGSSQIYAVLFKKLSGMNMVYFQLTLAVIYFTLGISSVIIGVKYYISNKKNDNEIS
jgi:predicted phage tail protein